MLTLTQAVQIQTKQNGDKVFLLKAVSDKFSGRNFGRDPALFVRPIMDIAEPAREVDAKALRAEISKKQDKTCQMADKEAISGAVPGIVVFPGAPAEFEDPLTFSLRTILQTQFDETKDEGRDGPLMLVGCISYRDQFRAVHHTRFCFISNDPISKLTTGSQLRLCHGSQSAD